MPSSPHRPHAVHRGSKSTKKVAHKQPASEAKLAQPTGMPGTLPSAEQPGDMSPVAGAARHIGTAQALGGAPMRGGPRAGPRGSVGALLAQLKSRG